MSLEVGPVEPDGFAGIHHRPPRGHAELAAMIPVSTSIA
jgi:hypothetical protein